jgi:hypothetical protein
MVNASQEPTAPPHQQLSLVARPTRRPWCVVKPAGRPARRLAGRLAGLQFLYEFHVQAFLAPGAGVHGSQRRANAPRFASQPLSVGCNTCLSHAADETFLVI